MNENDLRLVLGSDPDERQLLNLLAKSAAQHTLVVGQSGSGKSFFVARLIEEILLRTRARVLLIDPNGDYRQMCQIPDGDEHWKKAPFEDLFASLRTLTKDVGISVFDSEQEFADTWRSLNFQFVSAEGKKKRAVGERRDRLSLRWGQLDNDEQAFLLSQVGQTRDEAKDHLGFTACERHLIHLAGPVAEKSEVNARKVGLRKMEEIAMEFQNGDIHFKDYRYARSLEGEDWLRITGRLKQLATRHSIWFDNFEEDENSEEQDLVELLTFDPIGRPPWDAFVLGLSGANKNDQLLAANAALSTVWRNSQASWKKQIDSKDEDSRIPTFIVIDECHNFAPSESSNEMQRRVSDKILQIAAEGRKYGLFLILVTQRPRKLLPGIVFECENCALLRVQSRLEHEFAAKAFGIPLDHAQRIAHFRMGEALLHGRWMNGQQVYAKIAPARARVGGGGISFKNWLGKRKPVRLPDGNANDWLVLAARVQDEIRIHGKLPVDELPKLISEEMNAGKVFVESGQLENIVNAYGLLHIAHMVREAGSEHLKLNGDESVFQSKTGSTGTSDKEFGNKVEKYIMERIAESQNPINLAQLGNQIIGHFGKEDIKRFNWGPTGSLASLIRSYSKSEDFDLQVSNTHPAHLYDANRHTPPTSQDVDAEEGRKKIEDKHRSIADKVAKFVHNVPYLSSNDYANAFIAIADEVNENGYSLTKTSKAVRDRCTSKGMHFTRQYSNELLIGIRNSGYYLTGEEFVYPQRLSLQFLIVVERRCSHKGFTPTAAEFEQIKNWIAGELL